MPQYGRIIARLRKEHDMTQAELGEKLNVSFQAVSKWENDQSQPDFATMCAIAKLFDVPLTIFMEEESAPGEHAEPALGEQAEESAVALPAEEDEKQEPDELFGYCVSCGNAVRTSNLGKQYPKLQCVTCMENEKRKQIAAAQRKKAEDEAKRKRARELVARAREDAKRKRDRGLIAGGVVGGIALVISLISCLVTQEWLAIPGAFVIGLFFFTFLSQMVWGGAVRSVFTYGGAVIGTPGIIFTLDCDGISFLIICKVLFALVRFLVYIFTTIFLAVAAFLMSVVTFIPALTRMNGEIKAPSMPQPAQKVAK